MTLRRLRDGPRGVLRARREARAPRSRWLSRGTAAPRPSRGRARSHHEPDGQSRAQAQADGDARLRHDRRRVRAAPRSSSRGGTGRCTRFAGPSETPSKRAAGGSRERSSSPSCCRPFSGSSPRSSSPTRRCGRPPDVSPPRVRASAASGGEGSPATTPSSSCGCDDAAGAARARGHRRAALPALVRGPIRSRARGRARPRATSPTRRERCGASWRESDVDEWLDRHGGVFVLAADQLQGDERRDLEASARVVLDTRDGSLASRMARRRRGPAEAPALRADARGRRDAPRARSDPSCSSTTASGASPRTGASTSIAVRPGNPTPAPWCNVLANPSFGCLVSESSLGSTWSLNAGENRLTPWRNDPVFDAPAEALYLRDEETAAVWSPTPLARGGRRRDARAPRRGLHDLLAREPRARAGAHRLRAPRRARSRSRGCG